MASFALSWFESSCSFTKWSIHCQYSFLRWAYMLTFPRQGTRWLLSAVWLEARTMIPSHCSLTWWKKFASVISHRLQLRRTNHLALTTFQAALIRWSPTLGTAKRIMASLIRRLPQPECMGVVKPRIAERTPETKNKSNPNKATLRIARERHTNNQIQVIIKTRNRTWPASATSQHSANRIKLLNIINRTIWTTILTDLMI